MHESTGWSGWDSSPTPRRARDYVNKLETLHEDPSRRDIAWLLGIDDDVVNDDVRQVEVRNWIEHQVLPRKRV